MTREAKRTALTCVGSDETLTGGLKLKLQPRRCMHLRGVHCSHSYQPVCSLWIPASPTDPIWQASPAGLIAQNSSASPNQYRTQHERIASKSQEETKSILQLFYDLRSARTKFRNFALQDYCFPFVK